MYLLFGFRALEEVNGWFCCLCDFACYVYVLVVLTLVVICRFVDVRFAFWIACFGGFCVACVCFWLLLVLVCILLVWFAGLRVFVLGLFGSRLDYLFGAWFLIMVICFEFGFVGFCVYFCWFNYWWVDACVLLVFVFGVCGEFGFLLVTVVFGFGGFGCLVSRFPLVCGCVLVWLSVRFWILLFCILVFGLMFRLCLFSVL